MRVEFATLLNMDDKLPQEIYFITYGNAIPAVHFMYLKHTKFIISKTY